MKLLRSFLVAGILTSPCIITATATTLTSTITITDGVVNGLARDSAGILTFLGIPYAAPPVGNLRWAAPQPAARFPAGGLSANEFGFSCWATTSEIPTFQPENEDCLTVNVWTGAQQAKAKLPVMVWIYGGGFQFGASADPQYNGTNLATEGVIVVSFNYRLGVLGFLALTELDAEGTLSGNFGIQDQIAALKWVQANIAAFGGDPDNVTIFGQSAGAHSVGILLASPLTPGLFNKAIVESGAWWDSEHGSLDTFVQARQAGEAFEAKVGAKDVAEMRALPAATILAADAWNQNTDPGLTSFAPSIDFYVLNAAPGAAFADGQQAKVPLLAGWLADEEFLFLARAPPHATAAQFQGDLGALFGAPELCEATTLYPDNTPAQLNKSADSLIGDLIIREQTWEAADKQRRIGEAVYVYYFTYTSPYSPIAAHTAEIPFVFGNLGPNPIFGGLSSPTPSYADVVFSRTLAAYWTNFAKTGNPNGAGLPTWPAYQGTSVSNDILLLNNTIEPYIYNYDRFEFIEGFRINGVLPACWRFVDDDN